jgi:hypothetical protein
MATKKRCELAGAFQAQALQGGAWRLMRSEPAPAEIFLRGTESAPRALRAGDTLRDIAIEWAGDSAALTASFDDDRRSMTIASAIVHEPLAHLYEVLPLSAFGPAARRFWGRVFRVVRLPGGRQLLRILARRARPGSRGVP